MTAIAKMAGELLRLRFAINDRTEINFSHE
jgi:hypothetical protein